MIVEFLQIVICRQMANLNQLFSKVRDNKNYSQCKLNLIWWQSRNKIATSSKWNILLSVV